MESPSIGILGGTFDPIHLGHLRAAEEAAEALGLDCLLFVPAKLPPHKTARTLSDADRRLRMVRLAIGDNPLFAADEIELSRPGPSYSVETVEEILRRERPGRLWFVMGADQYAELHTWKRHRDLIRLADLAVLMRPPARGPLPPPVGMEGEFTPIPGGYLHSSGRETRVLNVTRLEISSSAIRKALKEGRSVRYLVPEAVLRELDNP